MRHYLALFLISLLFISFAATASAAGGSGSVRGELVERTEGAQLQAGAKAYLYLFQGQQEPSRFAQVDVDDAGQFQFGGLDTDTSNHYQVIVQYEGATYASDQVSFTGGATQQHASVGVYESTGDDKPVSIDATNLILNTPDDKSHALTILEVDTFRNAGSRTFVPSTQPRNGRPPSILRFSLPINASQLTPVRGIAPEDIMQVSDGFGALTQLLPGQNDLEFSFNLNYESSTFTFGKAVVYPTKDFRILVPAGAVRIRSPQLSDQGTRAIAGHTFEILAASNLQPGGTISLQLSNLPGIGPLSALSRPDTAKWLGLIPAGAVAALLSWYWVDKRKRLAAQPAESHSDPRQLEAERRALLIALARLDDRFDAGKISAEDYNIQREARKAELRQLMLDIEQLTA